MPATAWLEELRAISWAMEPERLIAFARQIVSGTARSSKPRSDDSDHDEDDEPTSPTKKPKPGYELRDGVAHVSISGVLMRSVPAWFAWFGIDATETSSIQRAIEAAARDSAASAIVLRVSSPGGDAQGLAEVGDAIYKARSGRSPKPVHAVVDGIAASGAYWLASQATSITAGPDAMLGSIGVYSVWVDSSEQAAKEGVKVHVIRSGEHKGMGTPGAPITDEQRASVQAVMDGLADLFVAAVAKGRGRTKTEMRELATGEVWLAETARTKGLVDQVEAPGKALGRIREAVVADKEELAKAAQDAAKAERQRAADLRVAFPKHPAFAAEQFEAGSTLAEAKAAFADVLQGELEAKDAELAKAHSAPPTPTKSRPGVEPPPRGADPEAGANAEIRTMDDVLAAARRYAREHKVTVTKALSELARQAQREERRTGRNFYNEVGATLRRAQALEDEGKYPRITKAGITAPE